MASTRKTIPVDALRELLGNDRTEELLDQLNGTKKVILTMSQLTATRNYAADVDGEVEIKASEFGQLEPVITLWLQSSSGAIKRSLREFVRQQLDGIDTNPNVEVRSTPEKRPRKKITDPEILEKRRAALAKARAVRQGNLAAQQANGAGAGEAATEAVAVG